MHDEKQQIRIEDFPIWQVEAIPYRADGRRLNDQALLVLVLAHTAQEAVKQAQLQLRSSTALASYSGADIAVSDQLSIGSAFNFMVKTGYKSKFADKMKAALARRTGTLVKPMSELIA